MDGIRKEQLNLASLDELLVTHAELATLSGVEKEILLQKINGLTQAQITGLLGYIAENISNKGIANGYASLDFTAKVPKTQLPVTVWEDVSGKPASTPANIDDAVSKKHSHSNKSILDLIEQAFTNVLKSKLDGIHNGATKTESSTTNGNVKIDDVETTVYIHPATHPAVAIVEDTTHRFFTDSERTKLNGVEAEANKYIHPATHNAVEIVEDPSHKFITDSERNIWNAKQNAIGYVPEDASKKGAIGGYASLDANGIVPVSQLPSNLKELKVVSTIADRDKLTQFEGLRVHVIDATADSTIMSGWAEYLSNGTTWTKVAENESIDVVLNWSNVVGRPTSTITEIDDAVAKKHSHANASVLSGTQEAFTTVLKDKIHDSSVIGTKTVDETAIGDKKALTYNAVSGKIVYETIIDDLNPSANTTLSAAKINSELGLKANDDAVIHNIGNETISGTKTFDAITVGGVAIGSGLVDGKDLSNLTKADIVGFDSDVLQIIKSNYDADDDNKIDAAKVADTVAWNGVTNKPLSTVLDIDDAVTKRHDHSNKAVLDTISADDMTKLAGISDNANNVESSLINGNIKVDGAEVVIYTHPTTHAATMIVEDATHRFATDSEKASWTAKQDAIGFVPENAAKKGVAGGYASLDNSGVVPVSQLPSNYKELKVVNDIAERDALVKFEGLRAHVMNATADPTVGSGWAEYICDKSLSWIKVSEKESIDVVLQWANIQGKPNSLVADIDDSVTKRHVHNNKALLDSYTQTDVNISDAVAKKHSHSNSAVLNGLGDSNGALTYNGTSVKDIVNTIDDANISTGKTFSSSKIDSTYAKTNTLVRQTVVSGKLGSDGNPIFIAAGTGLKLDCLAGTTPLVINFADGYDSKGARDITRVINADVTSAWSIPANTTAYLYIDRNVVTTDLSFGYSTLAPIYGYTYPTGVAVGQNFFNINEMKMYEYDGSSWIAKTRVFVGKCSSYATGFSSVQTYGLRGRYQTGWFGIASWNNYMKDHYLGTDPARCMVLAGSSYNLSVYTMTDGSICRNHDRGFMTRNITNDSVYISTFGIQATAENECYIYDKYGNFIGLIDRLNVIVERGW